MIEDGYLCLPVGIKIATDLDLSNVEIDKSGDYKTASLAMPHGHQRNTY